MRGSRTSLRADGGAHQVSRRGDRDGRQDAGPRRVPVCEDRQEERHALRAPAGRRGGHALDLRQRAPVEGVR